MGGNTKNVNLSRRLKMSSQSKTTSKYQNELIKKRKNDIIKDISYIRGILSESDDNKITEKTNDFIQKVVKDLNNSHKQKNDYVNLRMKKTLEGIHAQINQAVSNMQKQVNKARTFLKLSEKSFESDEDDNKKTLISKNKKMIKSNTHFVVTLYNGKQDLSIDEVENLADKLIKFDGKIQDFFNSLDSASTISNIESALDDLYQTLEELGNELEQNKNLVEKIDEIIENYNENNKSISNLNSEIQNREKKQNTLENRERHILKAWESYKNIAKEGKQLKSIDNNPEYKFRSTVTGFFSALKTFNSVVQRIKGAYSSFNDSLSTINKLKDL